MNVRKKKFRSIAALLLCVAMVLGAVGCGSGGGSAGAGSGSVITSSYAAESDTAFSDVAADAWYADAVNYVSGNGIMSGTGNGAFSPAGNTTRAMLTTILYRAAGTPAVSSKADFTDVPDGVWYADAVAWAASNNIVSGYGNGIFGSNDPVSREQAAAILWRYSGSPAAGQSGAQEFTDSSSISSYAVDAVSWARSNGVINGKNGNRFDPKGSATRAELASILKNYMELNTSGNNGNSGNTGNNENDSDASNSAIVVYFSATGSTKGIAESIADSTGADIYEITPAQEYTSADLNYNDSSSRVSKEHADSSIMPEISGELPDLSKYDTVFLGYPIWWGDAPNIIRTFVEAEKSALNGKTVVPFCTSASSGIGSSATPLKNIAAGANWLDGQRFSGSASKDTVAAWAASKLENK